MKIKFKRNKYGNGWDAGYYRGKGGISSLIWVVGTKSFWYAVKRMIQKLPYALKKEFFNKPPTEP